jgi:hypothetical protein
MLPFDRRFTIEFRHDSWFEDDVLDASGPRRSAVRHRAGGVRIAGACDGVLGLSATSQVPTTATRRSRNGRSSWPNSSGRRIRLLQARPRRRLRAAGRGFVHPLIRRIHAELTSRDTRQYVAILRPRISARGSRGRRRPPSASPTERLHLRQCASISSRVQSGSRVPQKQSTGILMRVADAHRGASRAYPADAAGRQGAAVRRPGNRRRPAWTQRVRPSSGRR